MSDGIYIAVSGSLARQEQLDRTSHNLANVDTPGFQARSLRFQELVVDRASGRSHVQSAQGKMSQAQGAVEETANPFDFAIVGDGYFTVKSPNGTALTKAGNFKVNENGNLVTQDNLPVLNASNNPVMVPPATDFYVDENGNIWDDYGVVDQIQIVRTTDPANLKPIGESLFLAAANSLEPSVATVQQGHIEKSNVNAVESMTELITIQRHFEAMQKLVQTFAQIDSRAARDLGSING